MQSSDLRKKWQQSLLSCDNLAPGFISSSVGNLRTNIVLHHLEKYSYVIVWKGLKLWSLVFGVVYLMDLLIQQWEFWTNTNQTWRCWLILITAGQVTGDPITRRSLNCDWITAGRFLPPGVNRTLHPAASGTYLSSLYRKVRAGPAAGGGATRQHDIVSLLMSEKLLPLGGCVLRWPGYNCSVFRDLPPSRHDNMSESFFVKLLSFSDDTREMTGSESEEWQTAQVPIAKWEHFVHGSPWETSFSVDFIYFFGTFLQEAIFFSTAINWTTLGLK